MIAIVLVETFHSLRNNDQFFQYQTGLILDGAARSHPLATAPLNKSYATLRLMLCSNYHRQIHRRWVKSTGHMIGTRCHPGRGCFAIARLKVQPV